MSAPRKAQLTVGSVYGELTVIGPDERVTGTGRPFYRVPVRCHYCGAPPSGRQKQVRSVYVYTGVDRKDNDAGYTIENVVPCCGICNHAKHTMSYEAFLAWLRRVAQYMEL